MTVAGIVVNYRTPALAIEAVRSMRAEMTSLGPFRIFVVDNASGDDSIPALKQALAREGWEGEVELILAPRNGGFGYGINLAARRALATTPPPDYFYVLNPDAVVVPRSLPRLVAFLDSHPDGGMAGSQIRDSDGKTQVAAFRFPSLLSEIENAFSLGLVSRILGDHVLSLPPPSHDCEVDWISGASMLIRRRAIESVGYFDEGFFLYFEEVDLCRSMRKAGFKSYFVADAPIIHIGAVSTGVMDESRPMPPYWFDSRYRYFHKHHGAAYASACDLARVLGMLVCHAKERTLGRPSKWHPHQLGDLVRASWKNLRSRA
jgi:N-acetylglucosaminyl-diphospho-decaprenol L-rhamnosyltransferase